MLDAATQPDPTNQLTIEPSKADTWHLIARQRIAVDRDRLFPFFADAANLGRLTPKEMHFEILTPSPILMRVGTLIDYQIRTWGVPMQWRTEITEWNPPLEFVDVQLRGPYAEWVHRHRFIALGNRATLMEDHVRFRLPLGRLGAVAGPVVRRQLRRIFAYRRAMVATLFGPPADAARGATAAPPGYTASPSAHPHPPR